ncbi:helix-turn-helix domain-containing protein [Paenibacillus sp. NPDC058071]|uniref:helix-turn-helix domain-containing protein n=1 Tax=Paenibacillus sp. NPDC058071 TaxID=3346326 RepID=UPI0036DC64F5
MVKFMDYMISPEPLRIIDLNVDPAKLSVRSLHIRHVGHLPGRTMPRQAAVFRHWAVVYIAGGSGYYRSGNGPRQTVDAGSLFFFEPDVVYDYGPVDGGYWDEIYFTIDGSRIQEWLAYWPVKSDEVRRAEADVQQRARMDRIFQLMESGQPSDADRAALLLESLLYDFVHSGATLPMNGKAARLAQLLDDLNASIFEPFDPKSFAERHHWSLSTLRRTISEHTGFALHEYVHRLKMTEAKNLLLVTDQTVKEIAATLGYSDVFYFSRLFKKLSGEAPALFRSNRQSRGPALEGASAPRLD